MAALIAHVPDSLLTTDGRGKAHSAVEMQMWHSITLLALAFTGDRRCRLPAAGFMIGQILFCLPVYLHAFKGPVITAIAPWGGTVLILSWFSIAVIALMGWRPGR